ncbi:MAG: ferritin family protein [Phycisphaerae bacterium]|nr:ferritin family protein [Phycisphaerae bacterium]
MAETFNADEILQIAERIERNGAEFYRQAAERADRPKAKALLKHLVDFEQQHQAVFAQMRAQLQASSGFEAIDPQGESAQYLRAMADRHVFDPSANPAQRLKNADSLDAIFAIALDAEKDSIAFYLGIIEVVPPEFGREKVDRIIREEMSHVTQLIREMKTIEV